MRTREVDYASVSRCVAALPQAFGTKDVSTAAEVLRDHGVHQEDTAFSAAVGRFLSQHRARLGLEVVESHGPRGAVWRKVGIREPLVTDATGVRSPRGADQTGVGPQVRSDGPFMKRMRFHQSWYRSEVLKLPFGTGPNQDDTRLLGSMLRTSDGDAGRNFLSAEIHRFARQRSSTGHGVDPFRCVNNMLSSQPLCFNLFGPLALDLELATACFRAVLPDVDRVLEVRVEFAPAPRREYLGDGTSFDAFVRYQTFGSATAFVGIERS